KLIRIGKALSWRTLPLRLVASSLGLAGLVYASRALTDQSLSLGGGYDVFRNWLFVDVDIAVWLVAAVFVCRCLAVFYSVVGGGVGGLFVPLVVAGGLVVRSDYEVIHPGRFMHYPRLGVADVLGAGYRGPLAAVMFVAETPGRPGFVVP